MNNKPIKRKIVLIDDEESIRLSGKFALDAWYDVTTIETTAKALELLKNEHFDLVLLDMFIKGEGEHGSLEFLKFVTKEYSNLPVVILSGTVTWMQRWDQLKGLGAKAYLSKPFEREKIREIIDKCIKGENVEELHA